MPCIGWLLVCSDVSCAQAGCLFVLLSLVLRLVTCMLCLSSTNWLSDINPWGIQVWSKQAGALSSEDHVHGLVKI